MTPSELRDRLSVFETKLKEVSCRVVPTSFDPNDPDLRAFPRPLSWKWSSCEDALKRFAPRVVMMRLPLFWQVEPLLHEACRAVPAPIFVNDADNMPVGEAAIRLAYVDTVVTDTSDSFAFSSFLSEKKTLPKSWIIIHRPDSTWDIPTPLRDARETRVAQEVHVFPGVPILHQCAELSEKKEPAFHASAEFQIEVEKDRIYISGSTSDPFPLSRLEIPLALRETGLCPCGKKIFVRN